MLNEKVIDELGLTVGRFLQELHQFCQLKQKKQINNLILNSKGINPPFR